MSLLDLPSAVFGDATSSIASAASQLTLGLGGNGVGSGVANFVSDQAQSLSSSTSKGKPTDERLFLTRARYADTNHLGPDGRGQFAYIKLLTNPVLKAAYATGDISKRDMTDSNAKEIMGWASNMVTGTGYDKFLLTGVSGQFSEKVQVKEVFGDGEVVYFFGRQPIYLNLTGILIDSPDNQWFTDWVRMYSEFFRGTQLAKNYELLKLVLPNMTAIGTITGMTWNQDASTDVDVGIQFQFLVSSITPNPIKSSSMVDTAGIQSINFPKVSSFLDKAGMNIIKSQVDASGLAGVIQNPVSSLFDKASALTNLGQGIQGIQHSVESITGALKGGVSGVLSSPLVSGISSTLTGIRSTLFSPVYGVLSSLTKLLTTAVLGARKIFDAFVQPVRNILQDITNISNQASALVHQVEKAPGGLGRYFQSQLSGLATDYNAAISAVGRAVGSIGSQPSTSLSGVAALHSQGGINPSAAYLQLNTKASFSKSVLTAGRITPTKAAVLSASASASPSKLPVLKR